MTVAAISNSVTHILQRVGSTLFSQGANTKAGTQADGNASGKPGNSASDASDGQASDAKAALAQLADRTGTLARQAGASLQGASLSILASGIGVASPRVLDLVV